MKPQVSFKVTTPYVRISKKKENEAIEILRERGTYEDDGDGILSLTGATC